MKTVEKPPARSAFRKAAYTAPVFRTTSIVGSYCAFDPRQMQIGVCDPHVCPPSLEIVRA
jgi:hypothetical protein